MNKNKFMLILSLFLITVGIMIFVFTLLNDSSLSVKGAQTETKESPTETPTEEQIQEPEEPKTVEKEPEPQQTETVEPEPEQGQTEPVEPEPEPSEEEPIAEEPVNDEPPEVTEEELNDTGKPVFDKNDWRLVLANIDNPLPSDFTVELMTVKGNYSIDDRAAPSAIEMLEDAKQDGIELQICSAYRAYSLQQTLFNNKVDEFLSLGYSREEAEAETATIIAIPGTSEHQTGLALDIVTPSYQRLNAGYAETDAAKWLKANAWKYGFILRYPSDKQEITKIMFEPWHYRYVGVEYAEYIMSNGICLEEFLRN